MEYGRLRHIDAELNDGDICASLNKIVGPLLYIIYMGFIRRSASFPWEFGEMEERVITRRDCLRGTAGTALAAALEAGLPAKAKAEPKAKVVLIRHSEVLGRDGGVRAEIIQPMLDEAIKILLEKKEPLGAWKALFKSSDVVGSKSNVWYNLPTPGELEEMGSGINGLLPK